MTTYHDNISTIKYIIEDISTCMKKFTITGFTEDIKIKLPEDNTFRGREHSFRKFQCVRLDDHDLVSDHPIFVKLRGNNPFYFKVVIEEAYMDRMSRHNKYYLVGSLNEKNLELFWAVTRTIYNDIWNNKKNKIKKDDLEQEMSEYKFPCFDQERYDQLKVKLGEINRSLNEFNCKYATLSEEKMLKLFYEVEQINLLQRMDIKDKSIVNYTIIIRQPVDDAVSFELEYVPSDYYLKTLNR